MDIIFRQYDIIIAMGIGWGLFAAIGCLELLKKQRSLFWGNFLLVLIFTIPLIDHLIKPMVNPTMLLKLILFITRNGYFLIGPFLLFYTNSLLRGKPLNPPIGLLHLLPFIAGFMMSLLLQDKLALFPIPAPSDEMSLAAVNTPPSTFPPRGNSPLIHLRTISSLVSPILYGIYCLIKLKRHRLQVPQFYSNKNLGNTLYWLTLLIASMVMVYGFNLTIVLIYTHPLPPPAFTAYLRSLPAMLFLLYYSYFSLNQPGLEDLNPNEREEKYKKSLLSEEIREQLHRRISKVMNDKKPYLNPDLTLEGLAGALGESKHHVSQVINSQEGDNFYSYINQYRIDEFLNAVKEDRYPNFTMLAIAMECGFRSSSSFYSLFKKSKGMTPKQYMVEFKKSS